jgi:hypothetical protein
LSLGSLILLIVLVGLVWFWLDSARARELATGLAEELCKRRGVQFLDGSAALASLGLARTFEGMRWRRVFGFSYFSEEGGRRQGSVTVVGARIHAFELDGQTTVDGGH